ncbi:MAG: GH116 family glycosyl hydrolase [Gemmatimonadaceae bacterium]
MFNAPCVFAAISVRGSKPVARVLEGPVPGWKLFGMRDAANGDEGASYGLPRFRHASFKTRFPFGTVSLRDPAVPLGVRITGWSPFVPGDADNSSLPVAALEYEFTNSSAAPVEAVFSFNAKNFLPIDDPDARAVKATAGGFTLWTAGKADEAWKESSFSAAVPDSGVSVNHAWFRGGWWDPLTMAWKDVASGATVARPPIADGAPSPGGSLFVPLQLAPGARRTVTVRLSWYSPNSRIRRGTDPGAPPPTPGAPPNGPTHKPWYSGRFASIEDLNAYWAAQYADLRTKSDRFSRAFYDSTLPAEVIEAVAANLTILKSPTVLRQTDGRLWAWEGCFDQRGCCAGTCTHVWNYAQAIPHLFPALERTLRETEFGPSQDERGHQAFRTALPIRPQVHDFHAASDGQLGGIMKVHREWRISGDNAWLRTMWPKVKASLDYGINTWDPDRKGWCEEPHHNTYDIEFWGPDGMITSFYLGALTAAVAMGKAVGADTSEYAALLQKGIARAEAELFDGEYFIQRVEWKNLKASKTADQNALLGINEYSPEARALLEQEGPKYQYGKGCLSDGVLGSWLALVCGVGQVLDARKVTSHLAAVHKYNLKRDLSAYPNPQRPSYANGDEGGLLLCTWPKGGELSLPFVYSNEVWTGIEYQVASHLMLMGRVAEGLDVVRACRDRYDGRVRNPFDEYECGHWYARALSSYALLQGISGARYDAVDKVLYLKPSISGDFRSFLATATGYGTVGVRSGKPFLDPVSGTIEVKEIRYTAHA